MSAQLPFRVSHSSSGFWETIAAFDCFGAAKCYASECAKGKSFAYRVTKRGKVLFSAARGIEYDAT